MFDLGIWIMNFDISDEILETMEQINRSVKAGQFSTTLAGHIFRLYGYLKHVGELLEQSHKSKFEI